VITHSVIVKSKTYHLSGPPIIVRGDSITIDFRGATLQGTDPAAAPDAARDTAIVIEGGSKIVLANARVHGFKIAILARGTHGLELVHNDLSDNWKPRLFSLVEHESLVDWLSFHHNDNDEWLRFERGDLPPGRPRRGAARQQRDARHEWIDARAQHRRDDPRQ